MQPKQVAETKKNQMKKLLAVIGAMAIFVALANADAPNNEQTVTVKKSDLPPEVVAKLETQQKMQDVTQNLKTVNEWAGIGKEIGTAIHDGLRAAGEETANFAETKPGQLTMFLVAWKVMAKDVLSISEALGKGLKGALIGIPFLIFVNIFLITLYYKTTRPRNVLVRKEDKTKIYEEKDTWFTELAKESNHKDGDAAVAFLCVWWFVAVVANIWILAGVIL